MTPYSHISVAVPILAELCNLPLLLSRLRQQTFPHFTLYCCVNNVEGGMGYEENQQCLQGLGTVDDLSLVVIDRSSKGLGWNDKKRGVGWARKVMFEKILSEHDDNEVIVSLDADTDFGPKYFEAILATLNAHPCCSAFSIPYYHPLSGNDALDRPMLRYECYMRHYLLNMLRIGNPYAFTALGSAMAFPIWAYRRVGGITPLQGGEDFYLLQKFVKTGTLVNQFVEPYCKQNMAVWPQGRISNRVPFGTGPAIARGVEGMGEAYPFYSPEGFDAVKITYDAFSPLFEADVETPMSNFLREQLATYDLWSPLRNNFKTRERFIHACTERVDGLRILQFLKSKLAFRLKASQIPVDFLYDPIPTLNIYRNQLFSKEMAMRSLQ